MSQSDRLSPTLRVLTCAALAVATALVAIGCASPLRYVQGEAELWGPFQRINDGPLSTGPIVIPAPVREGHCYRLIFASDTPAEPQVDFGGAIDSQSVGFPISPLTRRSSSLAAETVTVFGCCSQGTGTVQLRATVPGPTHLAILEAPFASLGPDHGPDIVAAHQWIVAEQQQQVARQAERDRQAALEVISQAADAARPDLSTRMAELIRSRGRAYRNTILEEVRGGRDLEEALVLEPGFCYLFAALGHQSTVLEVDVRFARVRNAAERSDEGGITYALCKKCTYANG